MPDTLSFFIAVCSAVAAYALGCACQTLIESFQGTQGSYDFCLCRSTSGDSNGQEHEGASARQPLCSDSGGAEAGGRAQQRRLRLWGGQDGDSRGRGSAHSARCPQGQIWESDRRLVLAPLSLASLVSLTHRRSLPTGFYMQISNATTAWVCTLGIHQKPRWIAVPTYCSLA